MCVCGIFSEHSGTDKLRSPQPEDQDKNKDPVFDGMLVLCNPFLVRSG